jgi:hypothetical protein
VRWLNVGDSSEALRDGDSWNYPGGNETVAAPFLLFSPFLRVYSFLFPSLFPFPFLLSSFPYPFFIVLPSRQPALSPRRTIQEPTHRERNTDPFSAFQRCPSCMTVRNRGKCGPGWPGFAVPKGTRLKDPHPDGYCGARILTAASSSYRMS